MIVSDKKYGNNNAIVNSFRLLCNTMGSIKVKKDSELYEMAHKMTQTSESTEVSLTHIACGGYGVIMLYQTYILKIVPYPRTTPNEYVVPALLREKLKTNIANKDLADYFIEPINCTYLTNLNILWVSLNKFIMLTHLLLLLKKGSGNLRLDYDNYDPLTPIAKEDADYIAKVINKYFGVYLNLGTKHSQLFRFMKRTFHERTIGAIPTYVMVMPKALMSGNMLPKSQKILSTLLLFQVLVFYARILKICPQFMHGDLKLDNILLFEQAETFRCTFEGDVYAFNQRYVWQISDFDLASLESNEKVTWQQDLHYFLHTVEHYKNLVVPATLKKNPFCNDSCKNWIIDYSEFAYEDLCCLIKTLFRKWVEQIVI